ncbi:MAG: polysaccharide deacetylase family protein [Bryobacteraceae bacterium]
MLLAILLAATGLAVLAHIAPFPFLLDAAFKDATTWRVPVSGSAKRIYLTFDDGPNPAATLDLLELLRKKSVRATFFLIDDYVNETTAPIVRRMFEDGHSVGLHTGRRWLFLRSPSYLANTLQAAADKIERLAGRPPCRLFRPHAGWRSVTMFKGAGRAGYKIVGWSWMSWDWLPFRKRTGSRVAAHLAAHAAPGKIIVIHDGHHKNPRADRRYAIEATRQLIDELAAQGYTFGTLCHLQEPLR